MQQPVGDILEHRNGTAEQSPIADYQRLIDFGEPDLLVNIIVEELLYDTIAM